MNDTFKGHSDADLDVSPAPVTVDVRGNHPGGVAHQIMRAVTAVSLAVSPAFTTACGSSLQSITETDEKGDELGSEIEDSKTKLDDAASKYGEANKELLAHLEEREKLHRQAATMHTQKAEALNAQRKGILERIKDKVLGALNPEQKAALDRINAFKAQEDAYNRNMAALRTAQADLAGEKRAIAQERESKRVASGADLERLNQKTEALNSRERALMERENRLTTLEGDLRAEKTRLGTEAARIEALKKDTAPPTDQPDQGATR